MPGAVGAVILRGAGDDGGEAAGRMILRDAGAGEADEDGAGEASGRGAAAGAWPPSLAKRLRRIYRRD